MFAHRTSASSVADPFAALGITPFTEGDFDVDDKSIEAEAASSEMPVGPASNATEAPSPQVETPPAEAASNEGVSDSHPASQASTHQNPPPE